jgi:hypothetical protein
MNDLIGEWGRWFGTVEWIGRPGQENYSWSSLVNWVLSNLNFVNLVKDLFASNKVKQFSFFFSFFCFLQLQGQLVHLFVIRMK